MLLNLYKALIQSILLYAIRTCLLLSHVQISIIETAQRRALKYAFGVPPSTNNNLNFVEADVLPFGKLIRHHTFNYLVLAATNPDRSPTSIMLPGK